MNIYAAVRAADTISRYAGDERLFGQMLFPIAQKNHMRAFSFERRNGNVFRYRDYSRVIAGDGS